MKVDARWIIIDKIVNQAQIEVTHIYSYYAMVILSNYSGQYLDERVRRRHFKKHFDSAATFEVRPDPPLLVQLVIVNYKKLN